MIESNTQMMNGLLEKEKREKEE